MAELTATMFGVDLDRLATFYRSVLGLSVIESATGDFVTMASAGGAVELSIVQIPVHIAASIVVAEPPFAQEDAAIKRSFLVADLDASRARTASLGGAIQSADHGWSWRGHLHCDGHDPEGNGFQVRAAVAV